MPEGEIKVVVEDVSSSTTKETKVVNPLQQSADAQKVVDKAVGTTKGKSDSTSSSSSMASNIDAMYLFGVAKQTGMQVLGGMGGYIGDQVYQQRVSNTVQGAALGYSMLQHPMATTIIMGTQAVTTIISERQRRHEERDALRIARARNGYSDLKSITTSRRH